MPPSRNWEAELKEIDRRIESVSDKELLPAKATAPTAAAPTAAAPTAPVKEPRGTSTAGVMARLVLAVALGVGMIFWPYAARCGAGLFGYLGAVLVLITAGVWTSIWTWRHRSAKAHVLSLLIVLWGGILGSIEVLPRIGYARPSLAHPATWMCK